MTAVDPSALPESVDGLDGRPIRVGDTIAYAVREGDRAALRIATVIALQWSVSRWSDRRTLKMKVSGPPHWQTGEPGRPVSIQPDLKRLVRIEQ